MNIYSIIIFIAVCFVLSLLFTCVLFSCGTYKRRRHRNRRFERFTEYDNDEIKVNKIYHRGHGIRFPSHQNIMNKKLVFKRTKMNDSEKGIYMQQNGNDKVPLFVYNGKNDEFQMGSKNVPLNFSKVVNFKNKVNIDKPTKFNTDVRFKKGVTFDTIDISPGSTGLESDSKLCVGGDGDDNCISAEDYNMLLNYDQCNAFDENIKILRGAYMQNDNDDSTTSQGIAEKGYSVDESEVIDNLYKWVDTLRKKEKA